MSKTKLRPAQQHDAQLVTELFCNIYEETKKKNIEDMISQKKIYVLKRKKKVIAAFSYTVYGVLGIFAIMYVHRLAVIPELQGQGIGTMLLSKIKTRSVKTGATAIFLYSLQRARKFYEKNKLSNIWRYYWWSNHL
ncbi:MAG: GNAT family N-acetyltransferase [Candidatus Gracilibacteria bacterium]|nr:GNAT family N-acetyltransferase [Candidatus Gracilibacteria bacterium]